MSTYMGAKERAELLDAKCRWSGSIARLVMGTEEMSAEERDNAEAARTLLNHISNLETKLRRAQRKVLALTKRIAEVHDSYKDADAFLSDD